MVFCVVLGSPTDDHSPVLNLSKSGGGSAGSLGDDHSGSEADGPDAPPSPRSPRSAADDDDDDNLSEPEDDDDKDQGNFQRHIYLMGDLFRISCDRI